MLIGHSAINRFFEGALAKNGLSSVYCFVGAGQVGKRTLAMAIASQLLGVPEEKLSSQGDFILVERLLNDDGKLKKDISVKQSRDLRERLASASWLKGYQAVIIDEVELLNASAGNALLKILEEPPAKTIFFLLTENEEALLPTIRSRSQLFHFALVPEADIAAGLEARGVKSAEARSIAQMAAGRPGLALDIAFNEEKKESWLSFQSRFNEIAGQPFYKQVKVFEKLLKENDDNQKARDDLKEMLGAWAMLVRRSLLKRLGVSEAVYAGPSPDSWQPNAAEARAFLDAIGEAKRLLSGNINPRLLLESIVFSR